MDWRVIQGEFIQNGETFQGKDKELYFILTGGKITKS